MPVTISISRQPGELDHAVKRVTQVSHVGFISFRGFFGQVAQILLEKRLQSQQFTLQLCGKLAQDRAIWRDMLFRRTHCQPPAAAEDKRGSGEQ